MLNSAQHEISNAHKYKNCRKISTFLGSVKLIMLFFLFINVKMETIVAILSRKNSMLNWVEHEKSFITLGPVFSPTQHVIVNSYTKYSLSNLNSRWVIYSTICLERKQSEQIHWRTNRRRLVLIFTIHFVIVKLHTKYELSILYGYRAIFNEKCWGKEIGTNAGRNKQMFPRQTFYW